MISLPEWGQKNNRSSPNFGRTSQSWLEPKFVRWGQILGKIGFRRRITVAKAKVDRWQAAPSALGEKLAWTLLWDINLVSTKCTYHVYNQVYSKCTSSVQPSINLVKSENISPFSSPSRYDKLQFLRLSCNKDLYRHEFQSDSIRKRNIVFKSTPSLNWKSTEHK